MKKFIKNNLKVVIAFIIGVIISGGVVYAANISASRVTYEPEDEDWEVSDVNSALNYLYDNVNQKNCIYATYSKGSNQQINISLDFEPSYFVAFFDPNNISYARALYENNSFYAVNNEGVDMSYFEKQGKNILSTFPSEWGSYTNSYNVYYFACK